MSIGKGKKVLVAMSGGVDSSVAAAMLKRDGYEVVGCFMRLGSEDSVEEVDTCKTPQGTVSLKQFHQGCCSVNDAADARLVAAMLDVPFYVLNFRKDFGKIIDYFVGEYNDGRTPNPCVRCNDWLKYGKLVNYARSIDADFVATGHYARVEHGPNPRLLRGLDLRKDQSYVLFGTKREQLAHTMLPIGGMLKPAVRALAQEFNLPVFDKPDSQEICFVPDNDYAKLVRKHTPDKFSEGDILDTQGNVVGQHEGHQHFTLGQRRGIGVAMGHPIYVVAKDPAANTVTVGSKDDLLSSSLVADQCNWLIDPPVHALRCLAKIRYNSPPAPATVFATGDTLAVTFDEPQSAVTPGQAVVCYDDEQLIGGGWIRSVQRAERVA